MNAKIVVLFFLVAILVLPDADAFWGRRRRRWRIRLPWKKICPKACPMTCRTVNLPGGIKRRVCDPVCNNVCKWIKGRKRDEAENDEPYVQDEPFENREDYQEPIDEFEDPQELV